MSSLFGPWIVVVVVVVVAAAVLVAFTVLVCVLNVDGKSRSVLRLWLSGGCDDNGRLELS